MKHGPIALLEPGFPVVAIVPEDRVHDKTVSNIQEVIARGATCVAVATDGDESDGQALRATCCGSRPWRT
jgi:glucosamine--fructose-6-phosphate aminotransferase (isomerizing)